ncbi:ABC transporter permease subunit, partial [Pseudomonas syringae pv. tagetis]|uniref:ABC transporter permease subunit n=1 Tax=Pseudomonas syringae group genomosp. 7 TaxID=251699 RepID=UPI00377013ED
MDDAFAWSILPELFQGLLVTVQLLLLGFLLAVLLGLVLAQTLRSPMTLVQLLSKGYMSFFRNTPLLVQLYVR